MFITAVCYFYSSWNDWRIRVSLMKISYFSYERIKWATRLALRKRLKVYSETGWTEWHALSLYGYWWTEAHLCPVPRVSQAQVIVVSWSCNIMKRVYVELSSGRKGNRISYFFCLFYILRVLSVLWNGQKRFEQAKNNTKRQGWSKNSENWVGSQLEWNSNLVKVSLLVPEAYLLLFIVRGKSRSIFKHKMM